MAIPPTLIGGRTMVPVRFVSESLDAKVYWEGSSNTVYIWSAARFQGPHMQGPVEGRFDLDKFTAVLRDDGTVWLSGHFYQLAGGEVVLDSRTHPAPVPGLTDVSSISVSDGWLLAVKKDGTVWELGSSAGQHYYAAPRQVPGLSDIVAVTTSFDMALALKRDGTVWEWGYGRALEQVPGLRNIKAIATGITPAVLTSAGEVWSWTWDTNWEGETFTARRVPPVRVLAGATRLFQEGQWVLAGKADGSLWRWYSDLRPALVMNGSEPFQNVVAVAGGLRYTVVLQNDGTAWAWAPRKRTDNEPDLLFADWKQPRRILPGLKVVGVAAGDEAILLLTEHGELWGMGLNRGLFGDGTLSNGGEYNLSLFRIHPELGDPVVISNSAGGAGVLPTDGSVVLTFDRLIEAGPALSTVVLTDPAGHSVASRVYLAYNRLVITPNAPLKPGSAYRVQAPIGAVQDLGSGRPSQEYDALIYTDSQPAPPVTAVSAGEAGTVFVQGGQVWAWGDHEESWWYGPTSTGLQPARVEGLYDVVTVSSGNSKNLALRSDGTVWAWEQAPPYHVAQIKGLPPVQSLAVGDGTAVYLTRTGDVWRQALSGDLSTGIPAGQPHQVDGLTGVVSVGAGSEIYAALKTDGTLWTWEQASWKLTEKPDIRQVAGLSDVAAISVRGMGMTILRRNGTLVEWDAHRGARELPGIEGVTRVQAGLHQPLLAQKQDGTVWLWTYPVDDEGQPISFDYYWREIPELKGATRLASGGSHFLGIMPDGTLWAFGENDAGQLGDGTRTAQPIPVRIR